MIKCRKIMTFFPTKNGLRSPAKSATFWPKSAIIKSTPNIYIAPRPHQSLLSLSTLYRKDNHLAIFRL